MRLTLSFVLHLSILPLVTLAQKTEREVLTLFFESLGGTSWTNKQGWEDSITNTLSNLCDWYGVICEGEEDTELIQAIDGDRALLRRTLQSVTSAPVASPTNEPTTLALIPTVPTKPLVRRVIAISLENNNLNGRLPKSLWRLPKLHYLFISYNAVDIDFQSGSTSLREIRMHDTVTSSLSGIGAFTNLMSIHISGSRLGNVILPKELFTLTKLEYLFMAECQLEGSIPSEVANLVNLTELNFYNNDLTGTLPPALGNLTALRIMTLSRNKLQGSLPSSLGTLSQLEELYLDNNQFTGSLPSFNLLPSLHNLELNSNQLTGIIPSTFLNLAANTPSSDVWDINLDNNNLTGVIPESLFLSLGSVKMNISMSNNGFTGFENTTLCNTVDWNNGDILTHKCDAIACRTGTTSSSGRATGGTPCSTCVMSIFIGTTTCLDASKGNDRQFLLALYEDTGGDHWHNKDKWLKTDDHCQWFGVECWSSTEVVFPGRIRRIILDNNGLIGVIPPTVYSLDSLSTLSLSRNKIVLGFEGIDSIDNMHYINIAHTDTTSFEGIEKANSFFQILIADQLLIQGTLPKEIYKASSLKTLTMSECELSGSLADDLGQLSNLQELYLWGNNIQGKIPSTIGHITKLSILSLASNRLTGPLPSELESLTDLNGFTVKDQISKGGGLSGDLLSFPFSPGLNNLILGSNKFERTIPSTLLQAMTDLNAHLIVDLSSNKLTGTVPGSLIRFPRMNLMVEDNLLDGIDQRLCGMDDWMGGAVGVFGCDAILCPMYTANTWGRLVYDNQDCLNCPDPGPNARSILGQTVCGANDDTLDEHNVLQKFFDECMGKDWTDRDNWNKDVSICEWYGVSCDDAKSVVSIVLGENNIVGTLPTYIFSLPNLAHLSLFGNPQLKVSFESIDKALNLQGLVLDDTSLQSLTGIGKARGLTELSVQLNGLAGPLPEELSRLVNLKKLDLSNNKFTGTLPTWLDRMTGLQSFLVNDNLISGNLVDFSGLERITLVNVSSNVIEGPVPETFLMHAGVDDKIFVDISANRLTGTLPFGLQRLNRLGIKADQNKISGIDPALCTLAAWNDYDVQDFGCDAILCAAGSYNEYGRQINADSRCEPCGEASYYGAAQCSSGIRLLVGLVLTAFVCLGSFFV